MKVIVIAVVIAVALLVVPAAFAVNGSGGAGQDYGTHHAGMAQDGTLGAGMNPGQMHDGFSGWTGPT